MLCINRKEKQRVYIGDNIEIVILSIDQKKVKIGFIAPREINIAREEIINHPQKEKKSASIKYKHKKSIVVK